MKRFARANETRRAGGNDRQPAETTGRGALECQSAAFRIPSGEHYLDCAYMGPLPRVSEAAGLRAIRRMRSPTRIPAPGAFWEVDRLRAVFARLIGVDDPTRIAIQPGVSYGVATAARNLPINSQQNVVLTHEQFPADYYAWERHVASSGAELRAVRPPARGARGHQWNERLLEAIDSKTAIVSVPNVHWMDGTVFDLLAIGRRCRDVGAALVVDGTQSVGALPFDVKQIEPDVVISAAYKWLLGPYSLSLAYYGPRFDEGTPLEETWTARKGSRDFENLTDYSGEYAPGAARYDVSERANFLLAPIAQRSIELLLDWRPRRIQNYCRTLTGHLLSRISAMGYLVEDEPWRACHLFGVRIPKAIDPKALHDTLGQRRVHVSVRGSSLRVSPNIYNRETDLDPLEEVLREAVR